MSVLTVLLLVARDVIRQQSNKRLAKAENCARDWTAIDLAGS